MTPAYILAARRTAVAPRGGAFRDKEAWELGAAAIGAAVADAGIAPESIDAVVMGNALYGGGNPARLAALAAGIPETASAMTVDTQCCAGLDAVAVAANRINLGQAEVVVAGGLESYSRSPIRMRRPTERGLDPVPYDRPPFSPWPDRDPDMLQSAASLAETRKITRKRQENYAIRSHRLALEDPNAGDEIVTVADLDADAFARHLTGAKCNRLPVLSGSTRYGLTSATTAVEADAAAAVVMVSANVRDRMAKGLRITVYGHDSIGGDPAMPALAPVGAAKRLLDDCGLHPRDIDCAEIMEAFAVQAMACIDGIGLKPATVNRRGGALARGHPIGASGAILAVRLWHDLKRRGTPGFGLAAIAAAGGLGSAMLLAASDAP